MSTRRKTREAALDAAQLRITHEMLDAIRSELGAASSDDPLAAVRKVVADAKEATAKAQQLTGQVSGLKQEIETRSRREQALRDTSLELQRRNKDLQILLLDADKAVTDFETVTPAEVRCWGLHIRNFDMRRDDPSIVESRLPLKAEDRLAVQALLGGYQFRRRLAELAAAGQLHDMDIPF